MAPVPEIVPAIAAILATEPVPAAPVAVDLVPLDRAIARMAVGLEAYRRAGDGRQIFLFAYRYLSGEMRRNLLEGRFADPHWMVALAVRFADLYFEAEASFEAGRPCAEPWAIYFRVARSWRASSVEILLLGMNAHIVHDLPLAISESLRGDEAAAIAGKLALRRFDHEMVNEVLEEAIDPFQDLFAARYARWFKVVDELSWRVDEWLSDRIITRRCVWSRMHRAGPPPGGRGRGRARAGSEWRRPLPAHRHDVLQQHAAVAADRAPAGAPPAPRLLGTARLWFGYGSAMVRRRSGAGCPWRGRAALTRQPQFHLLEVVVEISAIRPEHGADGRYAALPVMASVMVRATRAIWRASSRLSRRLRRAAAATSRRPGGAAGLPEAIHGWPRSFAVSSDSVARSVDRAQEMRKLAV